MSTDVLILLLQDYTIGYSGVPSAGRGQEYYTLRSTFMQGVSPPAVHIHFTVLSLTPGSANAPPIGMLPDSGAQAAAQESTQDEKDAFNQWLVNRWRQKDEMLTRFYRDGDFLGGAYLARRGKRGTVQGEQQVPFIEIPVKLRHFWEFGHTVAWLAVVPLGWLLYKAVRLVV